MNHFYIAHLATYAVFGLPVLFALSVLFGAFEIREGDRYRFRTRRFLKIVLGLILLQLVTSLLLDYDVTRMFANASEKAEKPVFVNREAIEYSLRSYAVMFPDALNETKLACTRAALSNYIEDQWNKYLHEETCKGNSPLCAGSEADYYKALLKISKYQNVTADMRAIDIVLGSVWQTASRMYILLRQLYHEPDGKGQMPDPPDEQTLANYQHYLNDCASFKPARWATPDNELMTVRPHLCFGGCQ